MIAYAAIDLHDGHVVQLVGGETDAARVVLDDPVAVARSWVDAGFAALHIVDLDAALGTGDNRAIVDAILSAVDVPVQIGGGIRTDDAVAHWIDAGVAHVVIGTRPFQDRAWLRSMADRYPDRLVIAADVRDGMVATHGWKQSSVVPVLDYVRELDAYPLGGVLVTDIGREGRLEGSDTDLFRSVVAASAHPVIASGGIAATAELAALAQTGAAGVILGMALYTGGIDVAVIAGNYAA